MTTASNIPIEKEQHDLSLRVMRLTRPTFAMVPSISVLKEDIEGRITSEPSGINGFALSQFLSLPTQFGDIHLGETFSCYISVNNHSSDMVTDLVIKTDLQTSTYRATLIDNSKEPISEFIALKSEGFIVKHKIIDIGIHILICVCTYTRITGEKKNFKKFFKFQVTTPFHLSTKVFTLPHGFALQAILSNVSSKTLFIDSVQFLPHEEFTCTDLTPIPNPNIDIPGLPNMGNVYMRAGDCRHYLFNLQYVNFLETGSQKKILGNLKISWKAALGDSGEWITEPIEAVSHRGPLSLLICNIPEKCVLEDPFTVTFKVINNGSATIQPKLSCVAQGNKTMMPVGESSWITQPIPPTETVSIQATFLPLKLGLQPLCSLILESQTTPTWLEFKNTITLFVEQVGDVVESITPPQPEGVMEKLMVGSMGGRSDSLASLEVVGEEKVEEFEEDRGVGREGGGQEIGENIDLGEDKPLEGTDETLVY